MSGTENEAVEAALTALAQWTEPQFGDLHAISAVRAAHIAYDAMRPIIARETAERIGEDAVAALTYQNHRDRVHVADLKAAVEAARAEEREVLAAYLERNPYPIRWMAGIPAPEACPFAKCGQGPLGRDELNAHIAECPEAGAMQERINVMIRRVDEITEHGVILGGET